MTLSLPRQPFFSSPASQKCLPLYEAIPFPSSTPATSPAVSPHPLLSRLAYYTICFRFLSKLFLEGFCILKLLGETFALSCHRSSQSINLWRSEEEKEGKWEGREGGREARGEVLTVNLALSHQWVPLDPPNDPTSTR